MSGKEIKEVIEGTLLTGNLPKRVKKYCVDTRILEKGDVFIALKGKNKDGHDYIKEAISKKAGLIICEKDLSFSSKVAILKVENTYDALWTLASFYRHLYNPFIIAITGSYGKTTTKEILYHILKDHYHVLKSPKNYNNHIGVPLTLLNLNNTYDICILELGMNHQGEIENLSLLASPDLALITRIGTSHIGYLHGKYNIFKAKMEITKGLENGILIVNGDDPYLKNVKPKNNYDVICCGKNSPYNMKAYDIYEDFDFLSFKIKYNKKEYQIETNVTGSHFIMNLLLSIETSLLLNVEIEEIVESLKQYQPVGGRMQVIYKNEYTIISDIYNASYESYKALFDFAKKRKEEKIFILADILELGSYSKKYHKKIGRMLHKIKNKKVLLTGEETKYIKGKNIYHFKNNEEIIKYLEKEKKKDKLIFLKGSRGMHLEQITEFLKK